MALQHEIGCETAATKVGSTLRVIIDEYDESTDTYIGRTEYDSPEVDCIVYVESDDELTPGDICMVEISSSEDFDLRGHIVATA